MSQANLKSFNYASNHPNHASTINRLAGCSTYFTAMPNYVGLNNPREKL